MLLQAEDVTRVVEFCRENRPQAIFVGAKNQFCKALKEDISRIGDFILDAHAQVGHSYYTSLQVISLLRWRLKLESRMFFQLVVDSLVSPKCCVDLRSTYPVNFGKTILLLLPDFDLWSRHGHHRGLLRRGDAGRALGHL